MKGAGVGGTYSSCGPDSAPTTGTGFTVMDASNIDDPKVRKFIYSD